jgi:hypothetical protein
MKSNKVCYFLALSIILVLLVPVSAVPTYAASGAISLTPSQGKIGDWIEINGWGFDANKAVYIYFSSHEASVGDDIDEAIAYKRLTIAGTDADGAFTRSYSFAVPEELADGRVKEDVHGGDYYVYVTSYPSKSILSVAIFTVIDGEIEVDPEEGTVGSEVKISGEGLRNNQKISVEYEGDKVDIISGDGETDIKGQFTCTIIIPESPIGDNTIAVIDESGNKPEAEFSVKPKITLDPTKEAIGSAVNISGTGFGKRELITITVDGSKTPTSPLFIYTNRYGSFSGSFLVPFLYGYGSSKVEASDTRLDWAETQLTILAGITLDPITSPTSPGHVGMELTVRGAGLIANAPIAVTYTNNDEDIPVATATADANGNFSAKFIVPPSVAGSHAVTATDGTSTITSAFIMESQSPPVPVLLSPKVASTAEVETYFDWEDVTDPSGVSYTLQVASDANFTTLVLEKEGLQHSEYTVAKGEELESTGKKAYYWRVKAVDGASNESEWAPPGLFYVGFSPTSMPGWVWYIFYGLGVLLLVIVGFWVRRWRRE